MLSRIIRDWYKCLRANAIARAAYEPIRRFPLFFVLKQEESHDLNGHDEYTDSI